MNGALFRAFLPDPAVGFGGGGRAPLQRAARRGHIRAGASLLAFTVLLAGCASSGDVMSSYVPLRCNGAALPFGSFDVRQEEVPGFIAPVLETALAGSLERVGLRRVAGGEPADVTMVARFALINLNPAVGPDGTRADAFGDRVVPGEVTRFVAHVDLELRDNRDGALVWRGTMDRPHAIMGGETFHDDRAVLIVANTLDGMLRGLMKPCPP